MDYTEELKIWDSAIINIVTIKHGLLVRQDVADYFESSAFVYVTGSHGKVVADGLSYPVKTNCLFHVAPNKQITISSETDELEYYIVLYRADLYPSAGRRLLADTLRHNPFRQSYAVRTSTPIVFSNHFIAMANEWSNLTPLSMLKIKQSFYSLICTLYAELVSQRANHVEYDPFDFVYQYLQKNYLKPILIQDLSDSLGIARSTLHKQFKDRIGISPQQYLMQLRLDAASRLLMNSQMPVDEIAASCGLRDKSYLTRVFKGRYGITPGVFRKDHAQTEEKVIRAGRMTPLQALDNGEEYTTIESMGRIHRYFEVPRRIVCLNYAAAELCAALGIADKITGVASAEEALADCAKEYQGEIAKAPFLPAASSEINVPSFRAVCDCKPDIVIGTGYSFNRYGGIADAEEFEEKGIHIYAAKATYTLNCSYESIYEDIWNLGRIFGKEIRAEELIQSMKEEEILLSDTIRQYDTPIRVFSFDTLVSNKIITCGQSLENHIIRSAGGVNVFGDRAGQFITVDWQEVCAANPQVILVHCFHSQQDGLQKIAFLKQIPEIAQTEAIKNNQIHLIGIKRVFPAIDNLKTATYLADVFRGISS